MLLTPQFTAGFSVMRLKYQQNGRKGEWTVGLSIRAVDSGGRTVDFYLSSRRSSNAAYRFLWEILNTVQRSQIPRFINTVKAPTYGRVLALLKCEGRYPSDVEHRQIKSRNNVIEA